MDHSEELRLNPLLEKSGRCESSSRPRKGKISLWLSDPNTGFLFTAVGAVWGQIYVLSLSPSWTIRTNQVIQDRSWTWRRSFHSTGFRNVVLTLKPRNNSTSWARGALLCVWWNEAYVCWLSQNLFLSSASSSSQNMTWRSNLWSPQIQKNFFLIVEVMETRWSPFSFMCASEKLTDRYLIGERCSALARSPAVSPGRTCATCQRLTRRTVCPKVSWGCLQTEH